jgi:hypothetical protein
LKPTAADDEGKISGSSKFSAAANNISVGLAG